MFFDKSLQSFLGQYWSLDPATLPRLKDHLGNFYRNTWRWSIWTLCSQKILMISEVCSDMIVLGTLPWTFRCHAQWWTKCRAPTQGNYPTISLVNVTYTTITLSCSWLHLSRDFSGKIRLITQITVASYSLPVIAFWLSTIILVQAHLHLDRRMMEIVFHGIHHFPLWKKHLNHLQSVEKTCAILLMLLKTILENMVSK